MKACDQCGQRQEDKSDLAPGAVPGNDDHGRREADDRRVSKLVDKLKEYSLKRQDEFYPEDRWEWMKCISTYQSGAGPTRDKACRKGSLHLFVGYRKEVEREHTLTKTGMVVLDDELCNFVKANPPPAGPQVEEEVRNFVELRVEIQTLRRCRQCDQPGHIAAECSERGSPQAGASDGSGAGVASRPKNSSNSFAALGSSGGSQSSDSSGSSQTKAFRPLTD